VVQFGDPVVGLYEGEAAQAAMELQDPICFKDEDEAIRLYQRSQVQGC